MNGSQASTPRSDRPRTTRRRACLAAIAVALTATSGAVLAADYPAHTVRIVVPFTAGGSTDLLARLYAERLTRALGQPFIVENRPGAGSALGSDAVAKAAPDGYTLLLTNTALIQGTLRSPKPPYDPLTAFAPVALLTLSPIVYGVAASLGVTTLPAYLARVRSADRPYSYGSAGAGQTVHMYGELLRLKAGVTLPHVAYKGEAPFLNDLAAGHVDSGFATVASMGPYLKSGRIRPLAVPGTARSPLLPEVPTLAELGFDGFDAVGWFGVLAPAGTPAGVVARLNAEANALLADPAVAGKLAELSLTPLGGTPEAFGRTMRDDLAAWARIVKEANITLE